MVRKRIFLLVLGLSIFFLGFYYRKPLFHKCNLEVKEIIVYGQKRTSNAHLFQALKIKKGDHMWAQSLDQIKTRIEELSWVKSASVQRRLPATLIVRLAEKEPIVIWQHQGKKYVVDGQGDIISGVDPKQFSRFIVITGEKAPRNFPILNQHLKNIIQIVPVKAATFLRSQRWDIYLEGGATVKLPDANVDEILKFLAKKWHLFKSYRVIDLRFRDALIFQEL